MKLHPFRMGDQVQTRCDIDLVSMRGETWVLPAGSRGVVQSSYGDRVVIRFLHDPQQKHSIHHSRIMFTTRGIRK